MCFSFLQYLHDYTLALSNQEVWSRPTLGRVDPLQTRCPCGTGATYDACCGPLLTNVAQASSPEQLMRSRYTAFVRGDLDHLFRTWHPRTRPDDLSLDPTTHWTGLRIVAADGATVEFVATRQGGQMHEVSRFEQRAGRWVYVDGDVE